jgi:hypothetical protein
MYRLTFLICTESEQSLYSEDRYTQNYLPILYPIYAEFMAVVESSNYFRKYHGRGVPHVKVDDLHMGEESGGGKIAYILPDVVDGIWIKDLELSVLPNMCTNFNHGLRRHCLSCCFIQRLQTLM